MTCARARPRRTPVRLVAALTTAVVVGLAACGVDAEEQPRSLSPELVPYELLSPTTTTTAPPAAAVPVTVYLVGEHDRLVPAQREVSAPLTVQKRLQGLLEPVTEHESEADLRSSIPTGTRLIDVSTVQDGLVSLNLSDDLFDVSGDTLRRALAQVVWTATQADDVTRVEIHVEGADQGIPGGRSGETIQGPVRRSDYADAFAPLAGAEPFVPPVDPQG